MSILHIDAHQRNGMIDGNVMCSSMPSNLTNFYKNIMKYFECVPYFLKKKAI